MLLGWTIAVKRESKVAPVKGWKRSLLTDWNRSEDSRAVAGSHRDKAGQEVAGEDAPAGIPNISTVFLVQLHQIRNVQRGAIAARQIPRKVDHRLEEG